MYKRQFEDIGPIVGRSATAARQLASRARRRVRGGPEAPGPGLARQREVVEAFLAALRGGSFEGLLAVLDPDLVVRADMADGPPVPEIRGAATWARQAVVYGQMSRMARPAIVDGRVGIVMAPRGKLFRALRMTFVNDRITEIEVIGNPARLAVLDLAIVES